MVVEGVETGVLHIGSDVASAILYEPGVTDTIDSLNHAYWTPSSNDHGSAIAALTLRAQDNSGALSVTSETVSIQVNAVNDAPVSLNNQVLVSAHSVYTLEPEDFRFHDALENDGLLSIQITGLPQSGQLIYDESPLVEGQEISASAIAAGRLYYSPAQGIDSTTARIAFVVRDTGGSANGGSDLSTEPAELTLLVSGTEEPVTSSLEPDVALTAVENSPASTVIGRLDAAQQARVLSRVDNGGFLAADTPFDDINRYAVDGSSSGDDLGGWHVVDGDVDLRGGLWASGPSGGHALDLNNGIELAAGDRFSQADINQQQLVYAVETAGTDSFGFRLVDGGEDNVPEVDATFHIESYAPLTLEVSTPWNILEGETLPLTRAHLDVSGGNTQADQLRVDVLVPPASAVFTRNGSAVTQFTLQEIDETAISVRHDGLDASNDLALVELYRFDTEVPESIATGTIMFDVADVADAPAGSDSFLATNHKDALVISSGQFGFDDANDGDQLAAVLITDTPVSGTLMLQGNPLTAGAIVEHSEIERQQLRYQPDSLTVGSVTDTIRFRLIDTGDVGNGGSNESEEINTISILVTNNHAPLAVPDSITVDEAGSVSVLLSDATSITANDYDPDTPISQLVVQLVQAPLHGSLLLNPDGTFVYRHDGSETLYDSFSYRVADSEITEDDNRSIARVEITISAVNDTPVAGQLNDYTVRAGELFEFSLPGNLFTDSDPDDKLTLNATMASGEPLPDWLYFDHDAGVFSGETESQNVDSLKIIVSATDTYGASVQRTFALYIEPSFAAASQPVATDVTIVPASVNPSVVVDAAVPETALSGRPAGEALLSSEETVPLRQRPPQSQPLEPFIDTVVAPTLFVFEDRVINHNSLRTVNHAPVDTPGPTVNEAFGLQEARLSAADYSLDKSKKMLDLLDKNRSAFEELKGQEQLVVSSAVALTSGLSIGYIVMLVRGGLLVGSIVSSLPAWTLIDPVPVLQNFDEGNDDQDESLESLVEDRQVSGEASEEQKLKVREHRF